MATLDFGPLFRTSIGFEHVPAILHQAMRRDDSGYPPFNVEKCDENQYRIVLTVAGFGPDDIDIVVEQNLLTVRGRQKTAGRHEFLYRGIQTRDFERVFDLADYIEVTGAMMGDGLLVIDLKRELPEALKPRKIAIKSAPLRHIASKEKAA